MEIVPVLTPTAALSPISVISIVPVLLSSPSVALTLSPVRIESPPITPSKVIAPVPDSRVRD